jgi:hypothetical protein
MEASRIANLHRLQFCGVGAIIKRGAVIDMTELGIGIAGLAVVLIAEVSPYRWPKMPHWITDVGLALGMLILGIAIAIIFRLHLGGDCGTP